MLPIVSFALAVLAIPLVRAQSLSEFPPCAQTCNKIAQRVKPCDFDDLNCICKDPAYLSTISQCEQNTCNAADIKSEQTLGRQKCAPVGIAFENAKYIKPEDIISSDDVIPQCAKDCITSFSTASGIDIKDYRSICPTSQGQTTFDACQKANCSPENYTQGIEFGAQVCSFVPGSFSDTNQSVPRTNYTATNIFEQVLCSQPSAAGALLNSTCLPTDYSCICNSPSFFSDAIANAQRANCNEFDFLVLVATTFQACKNVGVTLPSRIRTTAPNNGTVNGNKSTTTGAPPAIFTGGAVSVTRGWEAASVVAVVGIALYWL